MAPFLKGKGDFGPVIPALWLQGHLPSSPVPHISVKGRTSSARRAARLDEQKGLDLPDEQLITLIPFLLGAFPSMFLTWEQPGVGETLWTQGSCTSGALHAPCTDSWTLSILHFKISAETTLPFHLICALYLCTSVKPRFYSLPDFPEMLEFLINQKGFLFLKTLQLWIILLSS